MLLPSWHGQLTPRLLLFFMRWSASIFGPSDFAFRLPSTLAAIATVACTFYLIRHWIGGRITAPLAAAVLTFAPIFLRYSQEAKQYAMEAFCTVCILLLLDQYLNTPSRRRLLVLILGSILFIGLANIFPFLWGVVMTRLAWESFKKRSPLMVRAAVLYAALTLLVFIPYFLFFIEGIYSTAQPKFSESSTSYWAVRSPSFQNPLLYLRDVTIHCYTLLSYFFSGFPKWSLPLITVLSITGCISLFRHERTRFIFYFVLPLTAAIIAATVRLYPFSERVALYSLPLFVICASFGIFSVGTALSAFIKRDVSKIIAVASICSLFVVYYQNRNSFRHSQEDMRSAVAYYQSKVQPGDITSVFKQAWAFYHYAHIVPKDPRIFRIFWDDEHAQLVEDDFEKAYSKISNGRIWFLASHYPNALHKKGEILTVFHDRCTLKDMQQFAGAFAALFECPNL
ncbi:MAG: glycosyltransferase family 39 protein [Candidatus Peribacteraceae bacterium]|nr:glycosyltransferase family 39 protein [Candidatus Peribacteraceae bacterium]